MVTLAEKVVFRIIRCSSILMNLERKLFGRPSLTAKDKPIHSTDFKFYLMMKDDHWRIDTISTHDMGCEKVEKGLISKENLYISFKEYLPRSSHSCNHSYLSFCDSKSSL